ncbi:MAG: phosphatidylinositol-3-phosphatase [Ktedonobacteraceae bacterium]
MLGSVLGLVFVLFGGLIRFFLPSHAMTIRSSTASVSPLFGIFDDTTATTTPGMTPSPSVTAGTTPTITPSTTPTPLPRFDHIVIVIEENKGYSEIIGANSSAPYINSLAAQGMLFTNSHALAHPSEPNYLDLFSGSDQGVIGDACDSSVYSPPDLGGQLLGAKLSFAGYSEGLPAAGDTSCSNSATSYARKHVPWANFSDTNGPTTNLPYTSFPTTTAGYSSLPTVSFVIPNLNNDMHDGSIQQGDTWLQQNMNAYAQWAKTNNSLLLVTWDENDTSTGDSSNQIATIFVGQHVQVGTNNTTINHYSVLRTLEDMYGLAPANNAANASDILGVWN